MRLKQPDKIRLPLLAFAALFLCLPTSRADVLSPGGSGAPDNFTPLSGLTLVMDQSGTGTVGAYNISVTDAVYKTGSGTLDFLIQIGLSAITPVDVSVETPSVYLTGVSNGNFAGFTTDVGYITNGSSLGNPDLVDGTGVPDTVARTGGAGSLVGFLFTPSGSDITPGTTTDVLLIATNATQYDNKGTLGLSFSSLSTGVTADAANSITLNGAFEPTPEPSSLLLLSSGLVGLGFMKRKVFQS